MHLKLPTQKQKRQLWLLVRKFKRAQNKNQKSKLWTKIVSLYKDLRVSLDTRQFKKILGASCFVLSTLLSANLQAQSPFFNQIQADPFGLELGVDKSCTWRSSMQGDLDGDGDIDILNFQFIYDYGLEEYSCEATFYQNNGDTENPNFEIAAQPVPGLPQITEDYAIIGELADIDGDGDLDILATTYNLSDYTVNNSFIENIGSLQAPAFDSVAQHNAFGLPTADDSEFGFISAVADIDNDGDLDITGSTYGYEPDILICKNIGTADSPQLSAPESLGLPLGGAEFIDISIKDIDGDGDLDVLGINFNYYSTSAEFIFFENSGTQDEANFDEAVLVSDFNTEVEDLVFHEMIDMDADGDLDMIVFDYENRSFYCKNSAISSNNNVSEPISVKVGPNPTYDFIQLSGDFEAETIRLVDILGQPLLQWNGNNRQLSLDQIPSGNYVLQIISKNQLIGNYSIQKL